MNDLPLVVYLRDSGGVTQDLSVFQQEASLRKWAGEHGYRVTRVFADVAKSAAKGTVGRDQFLAMIEYMTNGQAEEKHVGFWDYSRWAREMQSGLKYLLDLRLAGVEVLSITDPIPEGPYGILIQTVKLLGTEEENKRKSHSVKRGMHDNIVRYKAWMNPKAPKGFLRQRVEVGKRRDGSAHMISRLVDDPETAPLVRRGFEMAEQGASLIEIMMATGLYTCASGVHDMLRNPLYKGVLEWGGEVYPGFVEPVIAPELWERVQVVRRENFEQFTPRQVRSVYVLSGMAFCGYCGEPMFGASAVRGEVRHRYYRCTSYRRRDRQLSGACPASGLQAGVVEGDVVAALVDVLSAPTGLRDLAAEQMALFRSGEHELIALIQAQEERCVRLRREMRNVADTIRMMGGSDYLAQTMKGLEMQLAGAEEELRQLTARRPDVISLDDVEAMRVGLMARLERADGREVQKILRTLDTRVDIWRGEERDTGVYRGEVVFDFGFEVKRKIGRG